MHELSLMEGLVQGIQEEALHQKFTRVHHVRLEVGRLAGVEVEALRFAFGPATEGTLMEGAHLEILERPGQGVCQACGQEVEVETRFDLCPVCGEGFVAITGGTELRVKDLDVD
jgi:hydrogenase nickel incorporation protein HypA/HybF